MGSAGTEIAGYEPSQVTTYELDQGENSGIVVEDIQTGTITHEFYVDGNPMEALSNPALEGIGGGQLDGMHPEPHPWFGYAYLVRRRFEHLVKAAGDQSKRRTKITAVWQRRPCPYAYEEKDTGTSLLMPMWWSLDETPRLIGTGLVPQLVYVQGRLLIRRWPNVPLSIEDKEKIHAEVSHTNGSQFVGKQADYWLFKNAEIELLYGKFDQNQYYDGRYRVTFTFIGDPIRYHKHWSPKHEAGPPALHGDMDILQTPHSYADLPNVHHITTIHRQSSTDWNTLITTPDGVCETVPDG